MSLRWLLIALLGLGCSDVPDGNEFVVPDDFNAERFFSTEQIWPLRIELSSSARASLFDSPYEYVEGRLEFGDQVFESVGVRLKGAFSFNDLNGKAAFKIKFDEYVEGQHFFGLSRLTLNNLRQDRAQLHEFISYRVFNAFGVPSPRASFVELSVNGNPYGLYANVESVDEEFLERVYPDGSGNLYEALFGADLSDDALDLFEQDAGASTDRRDLQEFAAQVAGSSDALFFDDASVLDADRFLRFLAGEAAIGHWDGYWKTNNYRIYYEPTASKWNFIPWGLDQSLDEELDPYSGAGLLSKTCVENPRCLLAYAQLGTELADVLESMNLPALVDELALFLEEAVARDPRLEHPPAMVARYQLGVRARLERAPGRLRQAFACYDSEGNESDSDNDGFGACTADCNDEAAEALPGGIEVCDGLDNDCNGFVDDLAECGCEQRGYSGQTFLFCQTPVTWTKARELCTGKGSVLAAPLSADENTWLWQQSQSLAATSWYLGVNDRDDEGTFYDASGEPISFREWAPGQPDGFGPEHCVVLAEFGDGQWDDTRCYFSHPFICRVNP